MTKRGEKVKFLPYAEAHEFVSSLELQSKKQWEAYCRCPDAKPAMIPEHPEEVYGKELFERKGGWSGWLGVKAAGKTKAPAMSA